MTKNKPQTPEGGKRDSTLQAVFTDPELAVLTQPNRVPQAVLWSAVGGVIGAAIVFAIAMIWGVGPSSSGQTVIRQVNETSEQSFAKAEVASAATMRLVDRAPAIADDGVRFPAQLGVCAVVTADGWLMCTAPATKDNVIQTQTGEYAAIKEIVTDSYTGVHFVRIQADRALPLVRFGDNAKLGQHVFLLAFEENNGSPMIRAARVGGFGVLTQDGYANSDTLNHFATLDADTSNSFGAVVVSEYGDVVGIVAAGKESAHVIPIETLKSEYAASLQKGAFSRAAIGVTYADMSLLGTVSTQGQKWTRGAYVTALDRNRETPIQIKDLILSVNDKQLNIDFSLSDAIAGVRDGDTVQMMVIRNGKEVNLSFNAQGK